MSLVEHERVRELLARAGLEDASPRAVRRVVIAGAIVCALGLWRFWPGGPAPEVAFDEAGAGTTANGASAEASAVETGGVPGEVVVHVAGAVVHPGVYRLPIGSRVADAVAAAGGALGNAALDAVNLARILSDGEQVRLPTTDEVASGMVAPAAGGGVGAGASGAAGLVNLNTASAAELETLPGIGAATAQKIVDDREANGPFATPEDLMRVTGIGAKKFEALKDLVTTG